MIDHLASGPAVALEVRQENAVEKFRKLCGPYDPEIARKLEPNTLRAKFGVDRVLNAVHCTDLPEDGKLEVHFIFGTLLK
jgi:nucleoside-diphosphate kinase